MKRKQIRWGTIETIAAVLSVIVGIVGVIVAVAAWRLPQQPNSDHSTPRGAAATPTVAATASVQMATVRWHGQLTLSGYGGGGVVLDTVPPHHSDNPWDVAGSIHNGEIAAGTESDNIAAWAGTTPPTREQCSTQIDTNPAHVLPVQAGSVICVRTADGRIATLTILTTDENFTETADVTVWA